MNLEFLITSIISQVPFVVLTIVVLYLMLTRRIDRLEYRMERLEESISRGFKQLVNFNDVLITLLQGRELLTDSEVVILRTYPHDITPQVHTKYYTEEVRKRLLELLNKPLDEYTWDDIFELENDLMFKEGCKLNRDDLVDYSGKLRAFIAILKGTLLRKGKLPKPRTSN